MSGLFVRTSALLGLAAVVAASAGCPETGVRRVANEPPIAIAGVIDPADPEADPARIGQVVLGDAAVLDGTRSIDPDLEPTEKLEYLWTLLARPDGSVAELTVDEDDPDTDADEDGTPRLEPDLAGTYRVQLIVVDPDGAESLPAVANVQAVPPSDLEIVMTWDTARVDLDVHLIAPDGAYWGDDDCFAWNPTPDWGLEAFAEDNPVLDADDDGEGEGPYQEVLTLRRPETGTYQVMVHYFADHGAALGQPGRTASPSVTVRAAGETVVPLVVPTRAMNAGEVWRVSELRWPERTHAPPLPEIVLHTELGGPPVQQGP